MNQRINMRVNPRAKNCSPVKMTVGAAVFLAIYPIAPRAEEAPAPANVSGPVIEEVTVTANRREQVLEAVPFNLAVGGPHQPAQEHLATPRRSPNTLPG